MIGIHDCGGFHNLGTINPVDEVVFHDYWEGQTLALLFVAALNGKWALDEFRHAIEKMPPADYMNTAYYVHWLEAIEVLMVRDGLLTLEEIEQRQAEIRAGKEFPKPTSEPDPEVVSRLREGAKNIAYVGLGARRPDKPQNFTVGQRVTAKVRPVPGHTRLPRFVWGKTGTIVAYCGTYPLADTIAHRNGENPEPTYAVRFEGKDLWGDSAEPNTSVTLDLYESYIDIEAMQAVA
jgi:nitrile hydratase beta subunit